MKLKCPFIFAILLSMFIGGVFGILLQRQYLPRRILREIKGYFRYHRFSVRQSNKNILLKTRSYILSLDEEKFDTEKDSYYTYDIRKLNIDEIALILIDVWKYHPNDGWLERAKKMLNLR